MIDASHFAAAIDLESQVNRVTEFANAAISNDPTNYNGLLISGPHASGKTMVLLMMSNAIAQSIYLDFNKFAINSSRYVQRELLRLIDKIKQEKPAVLLLDNIDVYINNDIQNSAIVSAFQELFEISYLLIVCTCMEQRRCHDSVLAPYRLGEHIALLYPARAARTTLLRSYLAPFTLVLSSRKSLLPPLMDVEKENLVSDLSQASQGFSVLQLKKTIGDALVWSQVRHHTAEGVIVQEEIMRNMQGVQTIECSFISSLLVDVTTPPVMLFCDAIITRLVTSLTSSATNSTSGVIVYGPSGTGKSSLVENIAHGCRKTHRVLQVSCAELIHKVVGESEKKLTEIFAAARQIAPSLLILDNIDTIIGIKSESAEDKAGIVFAALCRRLEIDGIARDDSKPVVVIATATHLHEIDKSLLRPGRLEDHIELTLPDAKERTALLTHFLSRTPLAADINQAGLVADLVRLTEGYSPANIQQIVTEACMLSARAYIEAPGAQRQDEIPSAIYNQCKVTRDDFRLLTTSTT